MNTVLYNRAPDDSRTIWHYHKVTPGISINHWHTHFELLYIHQGDCSIKACGNTYVIKPPAIILYRPFTSHYLMTISDGLYDRSMIHFSFQDLSYFSKDIVSMDFMKDSPILTLNLDADQNRKLSTMFEELFSDADNFVYSRLYLALIINYIAEETRKLNYIPADGKREYICDVLQYITENLDQPLELESTANMFGVGRTKLNCDMRNFSGLTFKQTVSEFRLTRAYELIESGHSISSAALECGYCSESHFIQSFRRKWGITPGNMMRDIDKTQ